jgi:hypothetical protein
MGFGKGLIVGALGALGAVFTAAAISVIIEKKRNKVFAATDSNDDPAAGDGDEPPAKTQKQIVVTGRSSSDTAKIISLLTGAEESEENEITFKEILLTSEGIADNCAMIKSNLVNSDSVIYCISAADQKIEDVAAVNTLTASGIKVVAVITGSDAVSKEQADSFKRTVAASFSSSESVIVITEGDDFRSKILDAVTLEE